MNEYIVLNIIYIMSVIFYVSFCKYTFFFLTLQIVPIKNIIFFLHVVFCETVRNVFSCRFRFENCLLVNSL